MLYQKFIQYCLKRKLKVKITEFRYLELRSEFEHKVSWWPETMKCIDWCYDNNKKIITTGRIRNWMNNQVKWSKERDSLKKGDKIEKQKMEPIWTPPV